MEQMSLTVEKRNRTGKGVARRLRRSGRVPGVVYGREMASVSVQVDERTFAPLLRAHRAGHHALLNLKVVEDGQMVTQVPALIGAVQFEPITGEALNVDFHAVSLTEKITTTVVIQLRGEPVGVENEGGVLQHSLWELQIECLPTQIPDAIEVEVSSLHLNDTLHVSDLTVPEGVTVLDDPEEAVASIVPPAVLRVEEPEEEAELEEGEEVEEFEDEDEDD